MDDQMLALVKEVHRKEIERLRTAGDLQVTPQEPATVHYTELPAAKAGDLFFLEWNTYRREVGRLLAAGHEGKWLVVKGESILGIFDTMRQADSAGLKMILGKKIEKPFMLRQILVEDPILKLRGYNLPWPSSSFQLGQTA